MIDELIESHLNYAHAIAADLARKYPPNITRADLESAAELGLVQAARRYDPSKRASFATFAYCRVRGAIFDEVRRSWRATHLSGSDPIVSEPETEPAKPARHGEEELHGFCFSLEALSLNSFRVQSVLTTMESPASRVLRQEEAEVIKAALQKLPNRHRFVLQAHYYEELSLVSIGRALNLSKSWVSRIHAQALSMVRNILQDSRKALPHCSVETVYSQ